MVSETHVYYEILFHAAEKFLSQISSRLLLTHLSSVDEYMHKNMQGLEGGKAYGHTGGKKLQSAIKSYQSEDQLCPTLWRIWSPMDNSVL